MLVLVKVVEVACLICLGSRSVLDSQSGVLCGSQLQCALEENWKTYPSVAAVRHIHIRPAVVVEVHCYSRTAAAAVVYYSHNLHYCSSAAVDLRNLVAADRNSAGKLEEDTVAVEDTAEEVGRESCD